MESILTQLDNVRSHKTIVFTNGVFDVLHSGHIQLLQCAKRLGNILVVGINSDASVLGLGKGSNRPINSFFDRKQVLEALVFVDFVLEFQEQTPIELIKKVRPHVHVKGGDYEACQLPEFKILQEMDALIAIVPTVAGKSSTNVIQQMLEPAQ